MKVSRVFRSASFVALAALLPLAFGSRAVAQTYTIELVPPPNASYGAKIKSISDDKALIVQQLDSRGQVMEDFYYGYSTTANAYLFPTSLSFTYGLDPGALETGGKFVVGAVQGRGACLDFATNQVSKDSASSVRSSFVNAAYGYTGVGWLKLTGGTKHAAEYIMPPLILLNDVHAYLVSDLGSDWITSELLGVQQYSGRLTYVGWGERQNMPGRRAVASIGARWVELHPSSYAESEAWTVYNQWQGGWGRDSQNLEHALIWQGTAASMLDLNPSGYGNCRISDMDSEGAVGYGKLGATDRATLWKRVNTPTGFAPLDLHQFLPTGAGNSVATGITHNGDIAGHFLQNGLWKPVIWHPIRFTPLVLSVAHAIANMRLTATLTVTRAAPKGGIVVGVGSSAAQYARPLVSKVTIPAGETKASFIIETYAVPKTTAVTIYATLGLERTEATLIVDPASAK